MEVAGPEMRKGPVGQNSLQAPCEEVVGTAVLLSFSTKQLFEHVYGPFWRLDNARSFSRNQKRALRSF